MTSNVYTAGDEAYLRRDPAVKKYLDEGYCWTDAVEQARLNYQRRTMELIEATREISDASRDYLTKVYAV